MLYVYYEYSNLKGNMSTRMPSVNLEISDLVPNERLYLYQKPPERFGEVEVYHYKDHKGNKDCYIIQNFEANKASPEFLAFVNSKTIQSEVAHVGNDAVMLGTNDSILLFRNTDSADVRHFIQHDEAPRLYTLHFKTAEFHTYMQLVDHLHDNDYFFSSSGRSPTLMHGPAYIRDDRTYDIKYYKGDIFHDPSKLIPEFDTASISTSFDLTNEQIVRLQKLLARHVAYLENAGSTQYDLFFNNCSYFAQLLYNSVLLGEFSDEKHYFSYHVVDELNFRDKGIYYNFLLSQSIGGIINNLAPGLDIILKHSLGEGLPEIESIKYLANPSFRKVLNSHGNSEEHVAAYNGDAERASINLNVRNNFGETPLHVAIRAGQLKVALELINRGADVDARDNNLRTPLYDALLQDRNAPNCRELIDCLILKSQSINQVNYTLYHTPLTLAVSKNDLESVLNLIEHGADLYFQDLNGDNFLHIAYLSNAGMVSDYLSIHYPQLAMICNKDGDLPNEVVEARQTISRNAAEELHAFINMEIDLDPETLAGIDLQYDLYPEVPILSDYSFLL